MPGQPPPPAPADPHPAGPGDGTARGSSERASQASTKAGSPDRWGGLPGTGIVSPSGRTYTLSNVSIDLGGSLATAILEDAETFDRFYGIMHVGEDNAGHGRVLRLLSHTDHPNCGVLHESWVVGGLAVALQRLGRDEAPVQPLESMDAADSVPSVFMQMVDVLLYLQHQCHATYVDLELHHFFIASGIVVFRGYGNLAPTDPSAARSHANLGECFAKLHPSGVPTSAEGRQLASDLQAVGHLDAVMSSAYAMTHYFTKRRVDLTLYPPALGIEEPVLSVSHRGLVRISISLPPSLQEVLYKAVAEARCRHHTDPRNTLPDGGHGSAWPMAPPRQGYTPIGTPAPDALSGAAGIHLRLSAARAQAAATEGTPHASPTVGADMASSAPGTPSTPLPGTPAAGARAFADTDTPMASPSPVAPRTDDLLDPLGPFGPAPEGDGAEGAAGPEPRPQHTAASPVDFSLPPPLPPAEPDAPETAAAEAQQKQEALPAAAAPPPAGGAAAAAAAAAPASPEEGLKGTQGAALAEAEAEAAGGKPAHHHHPPAPGGGGGGGAFAPAAAPPPPPSTTAAAATAAAPAPAPRGSWAGRDFRNLRGANSPTPAAAGGVGVAGGGLGSQQRPLRGVVGDAAQPPAAGGGSGGGGGGGTAHPSAGGATPPPPPPHELPGGGGGGGGTASDAVGQGERRVPLSASATPESAPAAPEAVPGPSPPAEGEPSGPGVAGSSGGIDPTGSQVELPSGVARVVVHEDDDDDDDVGGDAGDGDGGEEPQERAAGEVKLSGTKRVREEEEVVVESEEGDVVEVPAGQNGRQQGVVASEGVLTYADEALLWRIAAKYAQDGVAAIGGLKSQRPDSFYQSPAVKAALSEALRLTLINPASRSLPPRRANGERSADGRPAAAASFPAAAARGAR